MTVTSPGMKLVRTLSFPEHTKIVGGVESTSFFIEAKGMLEAYDLEARPTGLSLPLPPRTVLSVASAGGHRLAFASEQALQVVSSTGAEIWRTPFDGRWDNGLEMSFDRTGETLWLTNGLTEAKALHGFDLASGRTHKKTMGYSCERALLVDWSVDRAIIADLITDAGTLDLLRCEWPAGGEPKLSDYFPFGQRNADGVVPVHCSTEGLVGVHCDYKSVWRFNDRNRVEPSYRGENELIREICPNWQVCFGAAAAPQRVALQLRDEIAIYSMPSFERIGVIPCAGEGHVIEVILLAGDRIAVSENTTPPRRYSKSPPLPSTTRHEVSVWSIGR